MALKKGSIITCAIYDLRKQATLVGETLIDTNRLKSFREKSHIRIDKRAMALKTCVDKTEKRISSYI